MDSADTAPTTGATPARAVLEELDAGTALHHGPVSIEHGFMLPEPPATALPATHRAWDEAAASLPELWRDLSARRVLAELPLLDAGPDALPDEALWRASVVLGALAYSYVRCDLDHLHALAPVEIPEPIAKPWAQLADRLGRSGPLLAYDDLVTHNYRLIERDAHDPIRLENLRLLVPMLGNDTERAFLGVNVEIQARLTPVIAATVRAQECAQDGDRDGLVEALLTILDAIRDATDVAFPKIDPNPHAGIYADPAVWAKLVAPTGVPIVSGVPGVSGAGSTGFQLIDAFLGRTRFESPLGEEARKNRDWYAPNCRRFLDAIDQVSVRRHVGESGDRELAGLFQSVLDAYAGDRGYLGVHRRKVYGFIQSAYKVGRTATASGISGGFRDRTWRVTDEHLSEASSERYLEMFEHAQVARLQPRHPASGDGRIQRVTMDVQETGLVFRPGDRCAILPEHTDELVERTLTALRGRPDHPVPLTTSWRRAVQERRGSVPPDELPLEEMLRYARLRPLGRDVAKRLQALSGSEPLRAVIEARDEDRMELWDALEMAAATGYDVTRLWRADLWQDEALARVVPPEAPRMYSISEPPEPEPFSRELTLTIGPLAFDSPGPEGAPAARRGTGSTFLSAAASTGAPVNVRVVRPLRFALPADATCPIVMFAGGTGIAPFRGFIAARAADPAAGPTWMFAAARTQADLPYHEELRAVEQEGHLVLRTAFSREEVDGVAPRRVDEAIAEPATKVALRELLADGRALFYICGQAAFAASVIEALGAIAAPYGGDGREAIRRLVGSNRLMTDLFTTFAPRGAGGVLGAETYDASELVLHNDAEHGWWTAIGGIVYDMTEFRQLHPGGFRIIDDNSGLDGTSEYRAVLHHEDSEIEAMLAMYKSGFLRRLDFGRAWGVALSGGRLRYVPLEEAFRLWLRHLYMVVEHQNALRNDASVLRAALTPGEEPEQPTALKLMLAADLQSRMLGSYLPGIAGEGLLELWEIASGLFAADADATELRRALTDSPAVARGREATGAFTEAVRAGVLDPTAAQPLVDELTQAGEDLLAAVKSALRDGLIVFERHELDTIAHGRPVLDCLRRIPPAVAAYYERVATAAAGHLSTSRPSEGSSHGRITA